MKQLALVLTFLFTSPLYASNSCEMLLSVQKASQCHYERGRCATNIYHLAKDMKNLEGAEVLLIYDPIFDLFNPSQALLPDQQGWKFHVVLMAGGKVYDLDDPKSLEGKALPTKAYFQKYFQTTLHKLKAVRVPAETYVDNYNYQKKNPKAAVWGGLAIEPMGWILSYVSQNGKHHAGMPNNIILKFLKNQVPYYLISEEYHEISPPIDLEELLR